VDVNLGTGAGFSVFDVIHAVEAVSGRKVPVKLSARRAGDPAALVADATKAGKVLNWRAKVPDLHEIVRTAWDWHARQPKAD
jgi:UDP-glucose 4-epimerase